MKYLCLVYAEEKKLEELPPDARLTARSVQYNHELAESGHWVAAAALQSVRTATTVRTRGGSTSVTDGPFAETKEQLCGFMLVDASDLDEAIRLVSRAPMAQVGSIEIRPIAWSEDFEGAPRP